MMDNAEVLRLVRTAVKRYARACWWANAEDLAQVGALAVIEARKSFDPNVGATETQYYWRAINFRISRYLWAESTPVSGGTHRPRESLTGITRQSFEGALDDDDAEGPRGQQLNAALFAERARANGGGWLPEAADTTLDDAAWLARVRARLEQLAVAEYGGGGRSLLRVLLGEVPTEDVAAAYDAPVPEVWRAMRRLRHRLRRDEDLYALMHERRTAIGSPP